MMPMSRLLTKFPMSEEPVLVVQVSSTLPERITTEFVENLADEMETFPEILESRIRGNREEVVEFTLKPQALEYYGIDVRTVTQAFEAANRVATAGRVKVGTGEFSLNLPGLFENIDDIMDLPIISSGDTVVRVRDVSTVKRTFKDAEAYSRFNGKSSMSIEVIKRSGENIINTVEKVQALVASMDEQIPEGIEVSFSNDQSVFIERLLSELENSVIFSVFLVVVVILAFLGIRGGILVSISIPGAFLSGVLILFVLGYTVNMVVLFSLILSVGLLVDGAIVMVEYADREISNGVGARQAYTVAAQRMSWPIIASTLTTLLAFVPLMFWPGMVGQFMQYLPLTLIAVLTSSLFMALLFMPVLGANLRTVARLFIPLIVFAIGFFLFQTIWSAIGIPEGMITWVSVITSLLVLGAFWRVWMRSADSLDSKTIEGVKSNALPDINNLHGITRFYISILSFFLKTKLRAISMIAISFVALIAGWYSYGVYGRGMEFSQILIQSF